MKSYRFSGYIALCLSMLCSAAYAAPEGGNISSGSGTIAQSGTTTSVNQQSQNLAIDWQTFSIGADEAVNFNQPNASSVALNRVLGQDASSILGSLNANGQVFILNPNGVLFGSTAQVTVGGLVASTLSLSDTELIAGNYSFGKTVKAGSVVNQGNLNAANGGYIALLAPEVRNEGVITATLGIALLAAGDKVSLNLNNGTLLSYSIDQGSLNALAANHQLIQADGGQVILSALAADALGSAVVNNTGIIEARTLQNVGGVIKLMGDMRVGTVNVGGKLDASAPNGGDGGFIETSASHVQIESDAQITSTSATGHAGTWLIDPYDFTIAATGGDITGTALSSALGLGAVVIQTNNTSATCTGATCGTGNAAGNGDIFVNDVITWGANLLTLDAWNNIYINANLQGSGTASLALKYGQGALAAGNTSNYYVHASVDLPAGQNFSTLLGSNGTVRNFTVITSLGAAGSTTATDLQGMSGNLTTNYALGASIDATSTSAWNGGLGFAPIGSGTGSGTATQFRGTFEGLGHTISNLVINRPTISFIGLFGATGPTFFVRNLGLVGGSVSGLNYVGGMVGYNNGLIYNSYNTGAVSGGNNGNVGGLVGRLNNNAASIISNCYASGAVTSAGGINSNAGGLVGITAFASKITNSYATGAVSGANFSGGLVGNHGGSFLDYNFSTGSVSGTTAGGLLGTAPGGATNTNFWDITSSGVATSAKGTGMTTANMMTQANFTAAGWDFVNTWYMADGATRPFLRSEYSTTISNAHQLQLMSMDLGASYTLAANIDLSESALASGMWNTASGFVPIGSLATPFTGTFDGLTYSISNLLINLPATNYVGLFGYISAAALSNINVAGNVTGFDYVGGIAGKTNALSTISTSSFTGSVTGNINVGGIVGWNDPSTITDAIVSGTIKGLSNVGGIVGLNDLSTIYGATFSGTVIGLTTGSSNVGGIAGNNSGSVSNVIATGGVSGASALGGVTGANSGTISAGYWDTQISGQTNGAGSGSSAGTTGLNTAQMTQQANFTALDFINTWRIYEGNSAPLLTSFLTPLTITINSASKTYDGISYSGGNGYTTSITPDANLLGSLIYTGSSQGAVNAGSYVISAGGFYSNQYGYDITVVDGALMVNPATLTYSANTASRTYGATDPVFTGSVTGFVNGESLATATTGTEVFTTAATTTSNVGNYDITGSGLTANNGNYVFVQAAGNASALSINPATLTVTANNANKIYGSTLTYLGTEFTSLGLVNGESIGGITLASAGDAATASVAGNPYVITASAATGGTFNPNNYTIGYVNGALTVNPATLTYSANTASRTYGATDPVFTGSVTGFVNGESLATATTGTEVFTTAATTTSNVGNYDITGSGLTANNGNYVFVQAAGNASALSINPATLTVTANDASKTYDGSAFSGGNGVTFSGLVNGETSAVLDGTLAYGGSSQGAINVGSYVVSPNGLTGNNYTINYVDGWLNILADTPAQVADTYIGSVLPTAYQSGVGTANTSFETVIVALNTATNSTLMIQSPADQSADSGQNFGSYITLLDGGIRLPGNVETKD